MSIKRGALIGGEWKPYDKSILVKDPYKGILLAEVSLLPEEDLHSVISAAHDGFLKMKSLSGAERSEILFSTARLIQEKKEEFSSLITAEMGKPVRFASAEVDRAIATFSIAAEEASRIRGEVIPLDGTGGVKGRKGIVNRFPIGIVACITPFNFPLNLVAHKVAPAIAAGNSFILKPSPRAPLSSFLLAECLLQTKIPKEAVTVFCCSNDLTEKIVRHSSVAMLSFTGSAEVGWHLKNIAGKKKVTLELGGNAAVIVDRDADVEATVMRCIAGAFSSAGQVCIKVQRIFIHEDMYEKFRDRFIEASKKVAVGDPSDPATIAGPMIDQNEALRIEKWINEAVSQGASLLCGGERDGAFIYPAVMQNVASSMKVCSEEIFGPVVTLEKIASVADGIKKTNDSRFGLQAGIFSSNIKNIMTAYNQLDVGGVIVNDFPTFRVDAMPYGGIKDSGFGREGVCSAIQEMTEPKLLVVEM